MHYLMKSSSIDDIFELGSWTHLVSVFGLRENDRSHIHDDCVISLLFRFQSQEIAAHIENHLLNLNGINN